jgi:hypothetical protein
MKNEDKDKLVHAILTDKRLSLLGNSAREKKFAEMREKKVEEALAYVAEVEKLNNYKPISTLPRVDFIARLREVFKK